MLPSSLAGTGFQPAAGRFERDGTDACFVPRFPFVEGTRYALLVDGRATATIERPTAALAPATRVLGVYPSAATLPVNQLKLYVHFSAPMSEGSALRCVRARDGRTGAELEDVFLEMDPELWSAGRRRLTLLLDPGRIKRGLAAHEALGYPLAEGRALELVICAAFPDAEGRPLVEGARRAYRVGPALRERVDPGAWRVEAPAAGTRAPLVVRFDRPLDRALLEHGLEVVDVPGSASIADGESGWSFTPSLPWGAGAYALRIEARLEDLAGNSLRRVFDRELARPEHDPLDVSHVELAFSAA